ncbi:MAG: DUF4262 domain-containing protein [Actinobacteria bacterium]|nr:MAG: DUF4262 domain-containing protein [Actinomycetota bacterium]
MCEMCDGKSRAEVLEGMADTIATYGWAIQCVEAGYGSLSYAYTIGLTERFGHPELMIGNIKLGTVAAALNGLGQQVREGTTLRPYTAARVMGLEFPLVAVHQAHLQGDVFAGWHEMYRWLPSPWPLRVLEVLVPDQLVCYEHMGLGPYLAEAPNRLLTGPYRAARRPRGRRPER